MNVWKMHFSPDCHLDHHRNFAAAQVIVGKLYLVFLSQFYFSEYCRLKLFRIKRGVCDCVSLLLKVRIIWTNFTKFVTCTPRTATKSRRSYFPTTSRPNNMKEAQMNDVKVKLTPINLRSWSCVWKERSSKHAIRSLQQVSEI